MLDNNEINSQPLDNCENKAEAVFTGSSDNVKLCEDSASVEIEKETEQSGDEPDEKELLLEILSQMKELNEAVSKLSQQAEEHYKNPMAHSYKADSGINAYSGDELSDDLTQQQKKVKSKKKRLALAGEIFFYVMLVGLILVAFLIRSGSSGRPISIAGYSAFTVLTSSMQSEIPKGSLVITKSVKPEELKIGDDITYMSGPTSTITHRIIGITEKYLDTNERAFETKGIMNSEPDKNPVPAANVVGRVVFHSESFGQIARFASDNWPFLLFVLIIVIALFTILKKVFSEDSPNEKVKKSRLAENGKAYSE